MKSLRIVRKLRVAKRDMSEFGLKAVHERHYFHLTATRFPGDSWISYEDKPSDGTEGSIAFRFYWVPLGDVPPLAGELDEMLPELMQSLRK